MILTINSKIIMPKPNTWADGVIFPGPSFRTVVIDSGGVYPTREWMAENLAIDDGGEGITAVNVGVVAGYDYGIQYFYTWDAAQRIAASLGNGWRVPTVNDFSNLASATAFITGTSYQDYGYQLKSTSGWNNSANGIDSVGMGINAAGSASGLNSGDEVWFWTSTIYANPYGSCCKLTRYSNKFGFQQYVTKDSREIVRLVRDVV